MKAFKIILKIVAALAIVAGIVYVVVAYGDKIVAWVKRMLGICECTCEECDCEGCEECCSECDGCEDEEDLVEVVDETADEKDFEDN